MNGYFGHKINEIIYRRLKKDNTLAGAYGVMGIN